MPPRAAAVSFLRPTSLLLARKAGKQTAWSPHTSNPSSQSGGGGSIVSPLEADIMMWSPLPRDQTVEYEEDTGTNIVIQREFIGKKSRSDLSVFQNVPLVHSKIELERGKALIAQAINSRKDPREVTRGDADTGGYTNTEYNSETGALVSAQHTFTQDKVHYCHRFCRGIIPVEAIRHSLSLIRTTETEDAISGADRSGGTLSNLSSEELREVMSMAKIREGSVLAKFAEDPDGVMDEMMMGKSKSQQQQDDDSTKLPPLQAMMELCAIATSTLRGGDAALSTLVRGRTILSRAQAPKELSTVPGKKLEGADEPYNPTGRLFGLNATSRRGDEKVGTLDSAMRADYGAFEAYLENFGLSTSQLELQAEQYHAELNSSLSAVERFNAALRAERHEKKISSSTIPKKILIPATAKESIKFDEPEVLHYGTIDDEAADAAARSADATSRSPEEIKFWFSATNRDEVLHEALTPEALAKAHPSTVADNNDTEDGEELAPSGGGDDSTPSVELAALYAAYIKFATGESPLPYYSHDTSRSTSTANLTVDEDGITPAQTTSTSADGSDNGEGGAILRRRVLTERLQWRRVIEKCVLEDFHLLTPQDIDTATNLNAFVEISKLMDHKVGDAVRGIVQHQRQSSGGGSSGSAHRINATAPMDMSPSNPASRNSIRNQI